MHINSIIQSYTTTLYQKFVRKMSEKFFAPYDPSVYIYSVVN